METTLGNLGTIFISFIALIISIMSYYISSKRLNLELFNYRYEIYKSVYSIFNLTGVEDLDSQKIAELKELQKKSWYLFCRDQEIYNMFDHAMKYLRAGASSDKEINSHKMTAWRNTFAAPCAIGE